MDCSLSTVWIGYVCVPQHRKIQDKSASEAADARDARRSTVRMRNSLEAQMRRRLVQLCSYRRRRLDSTLASPSTLARAEEAVETVVAMGVNEIRKTD